MKIMLYAIWACLFTFRVTADSGIIPPVDIGDDYDTVISTLGQPAGFIKMEDAAWLTYDRGTVKLSGNRVVEADLVSSEAALERRERERAQYERRQLLLAEQKSRRIAEGTQIKQTRISDPYFQNLPAERQVAFWLQFQIRYPEVPCSIEYRDAMARYQVEQEQEYALRQQEDRIRDLEDRLYQAELQNDRFNRVRYVQYRTIYTSSPICFPLQVKPVHCTPVVVAQPKTQTSVNFASNLRYPNSSHAGRLSY